MSTKARYIMIGGFLGAGKTTAVLAIAEKLRASGRRVGLITNDQSYGLVDTAMLGSHGFDVQEITGGCFCCKFNSLVDASDKLSAGSRPDVFIAEPVGSCTDLKATVDYPLRRIYGDSFTVAPLSVMIDPIRASRVLGLQAGASFSKKVVYIYRKQLEEAEIIVVNKIDLLPSEAIDRLIAALRSEFPAAVVIPVSARDGRGIDQWIDALSAEPKTNGAMSVDYETYADGEALLGWLNCTLRLSASDFLDGNELLTEFLTTAQHLLKGDGSEPPVEIAHLKLTLTPDEGSDIAVANLVRTDGRPELSHQLQAPLETGQLIVNLRAEADPELLERRVHETIAAIAAAHSVQLEVEHLERFRPGKPTPTHRMAGV